MNRKKNIKLSTNCGRANDDIRLATDLSTALDRLKDATRLANEGRYRDAQALGRSAIEQIRASSDNRKIWARALAAQAQIEMEMYEHRVASQMFAAALFATRDDVDLDDFRVTVAANLALSISKQGDHDVANQIVEATI